MAEILLVNPRKRKAASRKKKKRTVSKKRKTTRRKNPVARKKRRTAAQRAATRKMIAANRRRARSRRRKNPVATKRRKPAKRRPAARRAPVRRRRRTNRRRSNPAFTMRSIQNQVTEAGIGAFGALGLDIVQGYLPIPANLKAGIVGTGVKALLAIGIGVVGSKLRFVRPATAAKMSNGALTVVLHGELKRLTQQFAPGIQMGEYMDDNLGYVASGYPAGVVPGLSEYMDDPSLGTYLPELSTDPLTHDEMGFGEYEVDYMEDMSYL